ncbi:hypothetical protein GOP47_0009184 [Adiantum capillus-veneris]|uniref:Uncharacterized protein n=1 Tax=Adiantum capillus-veneris TaxID=13818 RepID=A0A9D4UX21_ADICA|nr:hypothetical protein GOP47_0009184 [Adiantum capillus-veneris]
MSLLKSTTIEQQAGTGERTFEILSRDIPKHLSEHQRKQPSSNRQNYTQIHHYVHLQLKGSKYPQPKLLPSLSKLTIRSGFWARARRETAVLSRFLQTKQLSIYQENMEALLALHDSPPSPVDSEKQLVPGCH